MKSNPTVSKHKPADVREKELKLALYRIQNGRAHTGETKVSIAAVAREAGVSTALIHNHYPTIAETIRDAQGRSSRSMRDDKHHDLVRERKKSAGYRDEIEMLKVQIAKLASINEVLASENRVLRAKAADPKVVELRKHLIGLENN